MADLSLVFKATVVLAVALLAARVAGRAPASVRALVLASAFAVLLVLPLAIVAIPPRTIEIPAVSLPGPALQESVVEVSLATAPPRSSGAPRQPSSFRMPSLTIVSRIAWAIGALLFVAPIVVALWRLRRMRTSGLPWLEGRTLVAEVAAHSGVVRPVDVFLHEALAAPMTCGVHRPAIGLPIDAPLWTAADLRHALVHEMEHVRRRDWPVHLLARLTCALYWFHPLAWIAWRQLCLESERACDDAVLQGAEGTAYADQLVTLARRVSKHSPAPMLSMADRSNLSTRVSAVLDRHIARGRAGLFSVLLIGIGAWAILFAISPLHAVSTTTLPQSVTSTPTDPAFEAASIRQSNTGPAGGGSRTAAAVAQASAPSTFEVASVRRNVSGEQMMRGPLVQPGNRVVAQNIAVRFLITTAYSIEFNQIAGAPPWIDTDRFDIDARARPDASPADLKAMLRALLADRFRLTAHVESQERPIYTLVRARTDGRTPGLRASGPDCSPIVTPAGGSLPPPPRLPPPPPPGQAPPPVDVPLTATAELTGCPRMFFPGFIGARRISLRDFANSLTNFARRRVVDGTGLTGLYDIDLKFAVEGLPPGVPQAPPDDNVPTLLTAVDEQLGLKLDAGRAPVEILVIDRIEPLREN